MKKIVIVILLLSGFNFDIFSQDSYERQLKYWYLRDRLRYFIAPSENPLFDDGSYMVIIARNCNWTENNSFSDMVDYGQQSMLFGKYIGVLATEYYLLMQNGRVEEAEQTNNELYNALIAQMRRDKCEHFYNYPDIINGFFVRNDNPYDPQNPTIPPTPEPWFETHSSLNDYQGLLLDYDSLLVHSGGQTYFRNAIHRIPAETVYEDMSQDEVIFTLEGLALAYHFGSEQNKELARNLAIHTLLHCFGEGSWVIRRPTGNPANQGSDCNCFSYGFSAVSFYFGGPWLEPNALTHDLWYFVLSQGGPEPKNNHMVASLAAIGNAFGPGTEAAIFNNCDAEGWQPYYLWLRKALWNDPNCYIDVENVENVLDGAPCEGPWKLIPNLYNARNGWRCADKWSHSEDYQWGDGDNYDGIFSGIDYMILLNLYYICNGTGLVQYRNRANAIFSNTWPQGNYGSNNNPLYLHNFMRIHSTEIINGAFLQGNVTYYAGKEIFLDVGFSARYGANFHAKILPLPYCQTSSNCKVEPILNNCVNIDPILNYSSFPSEVSQSLKAQPGDFDKESGGTVIYPNPTSHNLSMVNDGKLSFQIIVKTMTGEVIISQTSAPTAHYTLRISQLNPGLYIISIIYPTYTVNKKFVKL